MFVPAAAAVIAGRYVLERVIGKGGMGEVWQAHDRELDSPCAVKFLLPHLSSDKEMRVRFLREARAVAKLRSPHAVAVLGAGEHERALYLAMELLEGESLQKRLAQSGKLDQKTTFLIVEQVAQALERAHQAGIVHRDLKPDNIWLWAQPDVFVKVLDFGVAKSRLELGSVRTSTGTLLGTPHYMSPEQANGERELDHRADLWSLGIITIECLTGKRPYESAGLGNLLVKIVTSPIPELSALDPDLPPGLSAWWKRALAHDPAERFQSASELVEALRPHLTGEAPRSLAPSPAERPVTGDPVAKSLKVDVESVDPLMTTHSPRPSNTRRRRFGALAAIAAAATALAIYWPVRSSQTRSDESLPPIAPVPASAPTQAPTPPGATRDDKPSSISPPENAANERPAQAVAPGTPAPTTSPASPPATSRLPKPISPQPSTQNKAASRTSSATLTSSITSASPPPDAPAVTAAAAAPPTAAVPPAATPSAPAAAAPPAPAPKTDDLTRRLGF